MKTIFDKPQPPKPITAEQQGWIDNAVVELFDASGKLVWRGKATEVPADHKW